MKILLYRGHSAEDGMNLRRWFVVYVLYMGTLAIAALYGLYNDGEDTGLTGNQIGLGTIYIFYLSLCCTFFPAPTAWIVLLMASPIVGLHVVSTGNAYISALATITTVAALGALGTAMANLNEYHVFTFLLRFGRIRKIRQTRFYRKTAKWFEVSPFLLVTGASFLPIPVDVIRWLAITHRYRRDHYFLAYFCGRFIRYFLLAATATCLQLGWKGIAAFQLGLISLIMVRFVPRLTAALKKNINPVVPENNNPQISQITTD